MLQYVSFCCLLSERQGRHETKCTSASVDSLSTCDFPAWGYGLRYQYGIFLQALNANGEQVEVPGESPANKAVVAVSGLTLSPCRPVAHRLQSLGGTTTRQYSHCQVSAAILHVNWPSCLRLV